MASNGCLIEFRESILGVFPVAGVQEVRAKALDDVGRCGCFRDFLKFKVNGILVVCAGRAHRCQQVSVDVEHDCSTMFSRQSLAHAHWRHSGQPVERRSVPM
jgi:hypothetical protein